MLPFRTKILGVKTLLQQHANLDCFHQSYFKKNKPALYPSKTWLLQNPTPALKNWIQPRDLTGSARPGDRRYELNYDYLTLYGDFSVPVERTVWDNTRGGSSHGQVKSFERFEAPLSYFLEWTKQKLANPDTFCPNESLYIAQCAISNLPPALEKDLPPPVYTYRSKYKANRPTYGRGDVTSAGSSIWMGIPPTETPLHADPNHNFLMQIAGRKRVRMIAPDQGAILLHYVKRLIAEEAGGNTDGLRLGMRGEEMMVGKERDRMTDFVWAGSDMADPEVGKWAMENPKRDEVPAMDEPEEKEYWKSKGKREKSEESDVMILKFYQADIVPGGAVYIPKGFYHSVRSVDSHESGINVSANWWFRQTTAMVRDEVKKARLAPIQAARREEKRRTAPERAANTEERTGGGGGEGKRLW